MGRGAEVAGGAGGGVSLGKAGSAFGRKELGLVPVETQVRSFRSQDTGSELVAWRVDRMGGKRTVGWQAVTVILLKAWVGRQGGEEERLVTGYICRTGDWLA